MKRELNKRLVVLGKSEATITMILDNLESRNEFPQITIVNNLELVDTLFFKNDKFRMNEITEFNEAIVESDFFLGAANANTKIKVFNIFNIPVSSFVNIIHQSSRISGTIAMGKGILINSLISIAAHVQLGNFTTLNRNASVGHHTVIDDFATINPGAVICGNVHIGKGTTIGAGAVVIDGISIGKSCMIGAGSVVVKNVPDNCMGYGNPFIVK